MQKSAKAEIRFYKVCTTRGHLGAGRGAEITFYIAAPDVMTAINKAQKMPAVKHSKFAVSAKEITKDEYMEGRKVSAYERQSVFEDIKTGLQQAIEYEKKIK